MKIRFAAVIVMAASLAACGDQAPQTGSAPATVEAPTPPAPAPVATAGEQALPDGLAMPVGFELRNVMERQTDKGERRNRSVYEFAEGDNAAAFEAVKQVLTGAGFKDGEVKLTDSGISATFRKAGYGRIQVSVSSNLGKKPKNPAAKGVVSVDWPAADAAPVATN